jgi:hypothetical protein
MDPFEVRMQFLGLIRKLNAWVVVFCLSSACSRMPRYHNARLLDIHFISMDLRVNDAAEQLTTIDTKSRCFRFEVFFEMRRGFVGVHHWGVSEGEIPSLRRCTILLSLLPWLFLTPLLVMRRRCLTQSTGLHQSPHKHPLLPWLPLWNVAASEGTSTSGTVIFIVSFHSHLLTRH